MTNTMTQIIEFYFHYATKVITRVHLNPHAILNDDAIALFVSNQIWNWNFLVKDMIIYFQTHLNSWKGKKLY